jgi:hypothetical protein
MVLDDLVGELVELLLGGLDAGFHLRRSNHIGLHAGTYRKGRGGGWEGELLLERVFTIPDCRSKGNC